MKQKLILTAALFTLCIMAARPQMFFFNYTDPNQIWSIEEDGDYFWAGTNGGLYKWFKSGSGLVGKYHIMNGLPGNQVYTIKKDHFYNQLWVGTNNGLARLNVLNEWKIFTTDDGLTSNTIKDIAFDLSGNKWLATINGLTFYDPVLNIWTQYDTTNGLSDNHVEAVDVDFQGNVWAGTWKGIDMYDPADGTWTHYDTTQGLPDNKVLTIATDDATGTAWFGTKDGIVRYNGYEWKAYTADSGMAANRTLSLAVDAQSNVWMGSPAGVSKYDGDTTWKQYNTSDGLAGNYIYIVNVDAENNKWFGNDNGVTRLSHDGVTYTNYITGEGLITNQVTDVAVDTNDNVWFATVNGVSKFDDKHWTSYYDADLLSNYVFTVEIDNNNQKWFGTSGGVSVLTGLGWIEYTSFDGLISNQVKSIAFENSDKVWFGTDFGISVLDQGIFTSYTIDSGLVDNFINDITIDDEGNKWIATDYGVSKYDDNTWITYTTDSGLVSNEVVCISIDSKGRKWFGTFYEGVSVYNDTTWTTYTNTDGLGSNLVQDIYFDAQDNVVFATDSGFTVLQNDSMWVSYTPEDGLAYHDVLSIVQDAQGRYWFGTNGGVSRGTCEQPEVDFMADTACLPGATQFINLSQQVNNGTIYEWDIKNNDTINYNAKNIVHTFSQAGKYQVKLSARNMTCMDTIVKEVVVHIKPDISIVADTSKTFCYGNQVHLTAQINNEYAAGDYQYEWSNQANTQTIAVDTTGSYTVTVTDGACVSSPATDSVQTILPYPGEEICMVTVDSFSGKNLVVWEPAKNKGISSYNVYKLIGNQYSIIGNIQAGELTVYEDFSSTPEVKAARYAITAIDTCNNESDFSPYHQTIHLGAAQGLQPNTVVLDWTPYVDQSKSFQPEWYYIYRGNSPNELSLIDSVENFITEWNDTNSQGMLYYRVGVAKDAPCDPLDKLKASGGPFSRSISNLEDNRLKEEENIRNLPDQLASFNIWPNPFKEKASIVYELQEKAFVSIDIYNMTGERICSVVRDNQNPGQYKYQLNNKIIGNTGSLLIMKLMINNNVNMIKLVVE
jgi:ligand-binding sensor domain-containing protein